MKKLLDWQSKEVVNIFDEVNLWSAPFGRLLLENMPMQTGWKVVDVGFGTGFPLVELSQRFGEKSKIYGIDIWEGGINRTKEKINTLELKNIEIIKNSAEKIAIQDHQIDLVTSNLGVNNFEEKEKVYQEIFRILKKGGKLAITTNPIGTFHELFKLFEIILKEMQLENELINLDNYIKHRNTAEGISMDLEKDGFEIRKSISDTTSYRFVDAEALLNHSLIRVGFREYWEKMIRQDRRKEFFEKLKAKINTLIKAKGEFKITIPMLYLEFEKK